MTKSSKNLVSATPLRIVTSAIANSEDTSPIRVHNFPMSLLAFLFLVWFIIAFCKKKGEVRIKAELNSPSPLLPKSKAQKRKVFILESNEEEEEERPLKRKFKGTSQLTLSSVSSMDTSRDQPIPPHPILAIVVDSATWSPPAIAAVMTRSSFDVATLDA